MSTLHCSPPGLSGVGLDHWGVPNDPPAATRPLSAPARNMNSYSQELAVRRHSSASTWSPKQGSLHEFRDLPGPPQLRPVPPPRSDMANGRLRSGGGSCRLRRFEILGPADSSRMRPGVMKCCRPLRGALRSRGRRNLEASHELSS